jgi:glycerate kinase
VKIVIAPQAFKGSLPAIRVARAIEAGVRRAAPAAETVLVPVADGGDGTLEALVASRGGRIVESRVTGPFGEPVTAAWGSLADGRTAVLETARACGLALIPPERLDPLRATTYGAGELLRVALASGHDRFVLGIGGSATNDGGAGMAQALGARLLDAAGRDLEPGGAALSRLERIDCDDLDPRVARSSFIVASDVTNPLCGPDGASAVYGPQKGATPEQVELLDASLTRFAEIVRRDLDVEVRDRPGAGAAGGLGAGLVAFLGAELREGATLVLEEVGLEKELTGADLVITGEGRIDRTTAFDKAPAGVASLARRHSIPVIAIAGALGDGYEATREVGIDAAFSLVDRPMSLAEAVEDSSELLERIAEEIVRAMLAGRELPG